jgi:methylated-DNA-protein-cysteine methyltransferase related protein
MNTPPEPERFNQIVWEIARQIPAGYVSTYGQIASMIPPPDGIAPPDYDRLSPRWVGKAMNATPAGQGIPWQRVINSQGKISLPEGSQVALDQRAFLEAEGVDFDAHDRVDFEVCGWDGPPADWLEAHGLFPPRSLKKRGKGPSQPALF